MEYLKAVKVYDGKKIYEIDKILNQQEYRKYYGMGNVLYKFFIEEINNCEETYLFIDATDRPTFQIKNAPIELVEKLKNAGL